MLVLGIESSCDETAAAVVEGGGGGGRVRSSVVATQHDLHAEYGGVVPEIASRAHEEHILPVIRRAVLDAGIELADLDAIAVGHRPGLVGSLLVGLSAAKALAWSLGVPLIGVDHVHAHLTAAALDSEPIEFPALGLVVSGGHTTLYRMASDTELTRLGGTITTRPARPTTRSRPSSVWATRAGRWSTNWPASRGPMSTPSTFPSG